MSGRLGLRPHLADGYAALAEAWGYRGEADRASYYTERALHEWRECGMTAHADAAKGSLLAVQRG